VDHLYQRPRRSVSRTLQKVAHVLDRYFAYEYQKNLALSVLTSLTLLTATPVNAAQSEVFSHSGGSITVSPGTFGSIFFDGGSGTLADPWQIGFGIPTAIFELSITGAWGGCSAAQSDPSFTVSSDVLANECVVTMTSAASQIFGVEIDHHSSQSTVYLVKTGSYVGASGGNDSGVTPSPAKYSGPEFSGLSGMGVMTGSTGKLEGKRLNEISSIEIGGKAATFTATSATELSLSLPAGLAPGLYDLVINSSAGKLTHINAIQVRAPKQSFSIMTRSKGKISEQQYLEHSLIASMQIPELNKARCVVNASSIAMARAMADRLCAIVKASNPNIETTVVEPRSSVKGDAVFARVSYGWN
jgi:hypothetical protein